MKVQVNNMATNAELRVVQNTSLFKLLKIKKDNPTLDIIGLDTAIAELKASMNAEEVAYVEKLVNS
jgi:hypothetical protein